ncbi:hypothetical protein D3C72_856640 [compost metagenome]
MVQVLVQAAIQDVFDAAELQLGAQHARAPLGFGRALVRHARQVLGYRAHRRQQRTRHVGVQDQQLGHAVGRDDVAIHLAVDLKPGHRTQQRRPAIELALQRGGAGGFATGLHRAVAAAFVELHVQHAGGVVRAFQMHADAQEVQRLVFEHGADGDATRQVRAELHPFEEFAGVAFQQAGMQVLEQFQPGGVVGFPDFGRQAAAHGARVLAGGAHAGIDRRGIFRVAHHVLQHVVRRDGGVLALIKPLQFRDAQHAQPRAFARLRVLRQQRHLQVHVQHARGVFSALNVAAHPEQVVGGTAQHVQSSRTQVSLVPPPWLLLTTSEPSVSATRHRPPGTVRMSLPHST